MRVLIVEDDEIFCQFLTEILESKAIEVVRATDALAGYEKAWSYPLRSIYSRCSHARAARE